MNIPSNQLQGIMDCTEWIDLAVLLRNKYLYCLHKRRMTSLTAFFLKTRKYEIMNEDKITIVESVPRMFTYPLALPVNEHELLSLAITRWIQWGETAVDLYSKQEGQWYKQLARIHAKDLRLAHYIVKKMNLTYPYKPIKSIPIVTNQPKDAAK